MEWGAWLSGGLSVVAIVVSLLALRQARRSADAAVASAAVAERDEARRVEEIADIAVVWEIKPGGGSMVLIQNYGRQTAHEVTVVLSPTTATGNPVSLETRGEVLRGGSYEFDRQWHSEDSPSPWVKITWKLDTADGPVRTVVLPFPPYRPRAHVLT